MKGKGARALIAHALAVYRQGRIRPRIAATFAMAQFPDAVACLQDRGTLGRVLLRP